MVVMFAWCGPTMLGGRYYIYKSARNVKLAERLIHPRGAPDVGETQGVIVKIGSFYNRMPAKDAYDEYAKYRYTFIVDGETFEKRLTILRSNDAQNGRESPDMFDEGESILILYEKEYPLHAIPLKYAEEYAFKNLYKYSDTIILDIIAGPLVIGLLAWYISLFHRWQRARKKLREQEKSRSVASTSPVAAGEAISRRGPRVSTGACSSENTERHDHWAPRKNVPRQQQAKKIAREPVSTEPLRLAKRSPISQSIFQNGFYFDGRYIRYRLSLWNAIYPFYFAWAYFVLMFFFTPLIVFSAKTGDLALSLTWFMICYGLRIYNGYRFAVRPSIGFDVEKGAVQYRRFSVRQIPFEQFGALLIATTHQKYNELEATSVFLQTWDDRRIRIALLHNYQLYDDSPIAEAVQAILSRDLQKIQKDSEDQDLFA